MLIHTRAVFGSRCPSCGRTVARKLSVFEFSIGQSLEIRCACGQSIGVVTFNRQRHFLFRFDCCLCGQEHLIHMDCAELLRSEFHTIACEQSDFPLAFLGPLAEVKRSLRLQKRPLGEMARELGLRDFFVNPEVMFSILEKVSKMAEQGLLRCQCGHINMEMAVYSDQIELHCEECGSNVYIPARTERDGERVLERMELVLRHDVSGWMARALSRWKKQDY